MTCLPRMCCGVEIYLARSVLPETDVIESVIDEAFAWIRLYIHSIYMITSWHGNTFSITRPLWGDPTVTGGSPYPVTKGQ